METVSDERELTDEDLKAIRLLMFGDENKDFPLTWIKYGLKFKSFPPYALEQIKSGPCGVIASVSAHVIDELLYGSARIVLKEGLLRPTYDEKKIALSKALAQIIWRARSGSEAIVATKIISEDGAENIKLKHFSTDILLFESIRMNIRAFMKSGGISLFIYSLLLTRGIETIKSDMDFPDRLIGEDSYASQEIVNLILTGHAVTNVFNGNKELNGTNSETLILKGIAQQSRIGFLSLSEYENNDQVGSYLKYPEHPIWVVNGNNHYLTLFGTSKKIVEDSEEEFYLFYTDSLSSHQEISLQINPKDGPAKETDNLPTTIKCLLTRWPTATVKVEITKE